MPYDVAIQRFVVPTLINLDGSPADIFTWVMPTGKSIHVKSFSFIADGEVVGDSTTPAIVTLDYTATGAARAEKASCSMDNLAIGTETKQTTAFTAATEFDVVAGETLIVELKQASATGDTTGTGHAVIYYTEINK